jgi:hypothetical protein
MEFSGGDECLWNDTWKNGCPDVGVVFLPAREIISLKTESGLGYTRSVSAIE